MFEGTAGPHVFAVPIGQDFAKSLVDGLLDRLTGQPPEAIAKVVIYVNTRRTATRLHDLLIARGATLLPDIRLITDLASEPAAAVDLPPGISPLRRKLMLSRLVGGLLEQSAGTAPRASVFDLADSLAELLDSFHSEGVPLSRINDIDVGAHSEHWELSRQFLQILATFGLDQGNASGASRLFAAASALTESWDLSPPDHPVIVAGSTGSRGATALFMQAVAQLPNGAVVLPGLDRQLGASVWGRLASDARLADHSQAGLAKFCSGMGCDPKGVPDWYSSDTSLIHRNPLLSLSLIPAPVTFHWREKGPDLAPYLAPALSGVSLIEAPTSKEEATAIALCLRQAVEDKKQAALITPDRDLSRRVAAELARWGLIADDSGGEPLHQTPPGTFLRLIADLFGGALSPKLLISILKHPLTDSVPDARGPHLSRTRLLEVGLLRGGPAHVDLESIRAFFAEQADPEAQEWAEWLVTTLAPLEQVAEFSLADWAKLHKSVAEGLAAGPSGALGHGLWLKDAGRGSLRVFDRLFVDADVYGTMSASDYRALFHSLLRAEMARDATIAHPLISIWGTLEARVQGADLVILGGLNENTWPKRPAADPWMNREMRSQIGLPLPERQVGLSAHDFQQASAAPEVVWTRSLRDGDAPSVASRWIIRLTNLLEGLGEDGQSELKAIRNRGQYWLDLASLLDQAEALQVGAKRPSPQVPRSAKPDALYVTHISRLINDPYSIYASQILGLRPLDPLVPEMDARLRGSVIHDILEEFAEPGAPLTPERLIDISRRQLEAHISHADTRAMWLGRIRTLADWITSEEIRRQNDFPTSWREVKGARELPWLGFTVKAKADRIGQAPDGSLAVFDYKTGAAPGPKDVERYEKQLPLEAAIAEAGGFGLDGGAPVTALHYVSLANGGEIKPLALQSKTGSLIEDTWSGLAQLIANYQSDSYGFTARDRPKNIKYPSDYDHLSRFGEWLDTDAPEPEPMV
jgi:double-strand break repair protein AddB